jgi:CxxC motif-containing protein (DUF1111 family)
MKILKISMLLIFAAVLVLPFGNISSVEGQSSTEAPTTSLDARVDDLFNGFGTKGTPVDECDEEELDPLANIFEVNKFIFEERETPEDGLGPTYNDVGCVSCHQNPITGGISQITEHRAGHLNSSGNFVDGPGGSLLHSRAIAAAIQERFSTAENVQSFRSSLNTIGDGFIEAIANGTLLSIRDNQPSAQRGTAINVPVVEAGGALRVGRFGWKNQHASLESFSGDAYLNEMGITNPVDGNDGLRENTSAGASVAAFDDVPDPEDDGADVVAFANFMRQTRAPGRGPITTSVNIGSGLFNQIGCAVCHVSTIVTSPPGTVINGGAFVVPAALGNKRIHPFSDFLLHNVGTGDGIVQNGGQATANQLRTPPLWGVRSRNRLMHDGLTFTFFEAIQRHAGQATSSRNNFNNLSNTNKNHLINFLLSL